MFLIKYERFVTQQTRTSVLKRYWLYLFLSHVRHYTPRRIYANCKQDNVHKHRTLYINNRFSNRRLRKTPIRKNQNLTTSRTSKDSYVWVFCSKKRTSSTKKGSPIKGFLKENPLNFFIRNFNWGAPKVWKFENLRIMRVLFVSQLWTSAILFRITTRLI